MRLKISNAKLNQVVTVDNDATLSTLIGLIDCDQKVVSVRYGYPPTKLDLNENNLIKSLDELNISSGEKIAVEFASDGNSMAKLAPEPILAENQVFIDLNATEKVILQTHKVPDDNSCLFHAIAYCIYKEKSLSSQLRQVVSDHILNDPITYNKAVLEKSPSEYSKWILKKDSWGGGIEIAILSEKMEVAVYVIDIDAVNIEKFNEDKFDKFIMIIFSGVHYDAVELGTTQTVFDKSDEMTSNMVLSGVLTIARQLKSSGHSFNTHKDKIMCNICKKIIIGEREAARHAESTGHIDFGQAN